MGSYKREELPSRSSLSDSSSGRSLAFLLVLGPSRFLTAERHKISAFSSFFRVRTWRRSSLVATVPDLIKRGKKRTRQFFIPRPLDSDTGRLNTHSSTPRKPLQLPPLNRPRTPTSITQILPLLIRLPFPSHRLHQHRSRRRVELASRRWSSPLLLTFLFIKAFTNWDGKKGIQIGERLDLYTVRRQVKASEK